MFNEQYNNEESREISDYINIGFAFSYNMQYTYLYNIVLAF